MWQCSMHESRIRVTEKQDSDKIYKQNWRQAVELLVQIDTDLNFGFKTFMNLDAIDVVNYFRHFRPTAVESLMVHIQTAESCTI